MYESQLVTVSHWQTLMAPVSLSVSDRMSSLADKEQSGWVSAMPRGGNIVVGQQLSKVVSDIIQRIKGRNLLSI